MSETGAAQLRLELHLEATGRGRRMVARLSDGTVLASGRHYTHLLENVRKVAADRYPGELKLVLMVGKAHPSRVGGYSVGRPAGLKAQDPAPVR
jgi:hypothetical protein